MVSVLEPLIFTREITSLKMINDDYPKYIITMDELPMGEDGIRQINVIDFLMQKKLTILTFTVNYAIVK